MNQLMVGNFQSPWSALDTTIPSPWLLKVRPFQVTTGPLETAKSISKASNVTPLARRHVLLTLMLTFNQMTLKTVP